MTVTVGLKEHQKHIGNEPKLAKNRVFKAKPELISSHYRWA